MDDRRSRLRCPGHVTPECPEPVLRLRLEAADAPANSSDAPPPEVEARAAGFSWPEGPGEGPGPAPDAVPRSDAMSRAMAPRTSWMTIIYLSTYVK